MSYAAKILDDNAKSTFLVVLKPKFNVPLNSGWTISSGSVYVRSFPYEYVSKLSYFLGSASIETVYTTGDYTAASSVANVGIDGDYYFDRDAQLLYFDGDPSILDDSEPFLIVAELEIYVSTMSQNWYRIPNDTTSAEVHFDGIVIKAPEQFQSATDVIFGVLPTQSTHVELANTESTLMKYFYDVSWRRASVEVYHAIGKRLVAADITPILSGFTDSVEVKDDTIEVKLLDQTSLLDSKWNDSTHDSATFRRGTRQAIRAVYGMQDGLECWNNFPSPLAITSSAATSNTRWTVAQNEFKGDIIFGRACVTDAGASTSKTYLGSVDGLNVDDELRFRKGATKYYATITKVDRTDKFVEHEVIGATMDDTWVIDRDSCGYCWLIQDGIRYKMRAFRDYASDNSSGIPYVQGFYLAFQSGFATSLSLPRGVTMDDRVFVRAYGRPSTAIQIAASPAVADDTTFGSVTNGVAIIYDLLRTAGITEANIDTATFATLIASATEKVGFCIPQANGDDMPTFKEVLQTLCQTLLCKVFIDENNKWTICRIGPIASTDKTIEPQDILDNSTSYQLEYTDVYSDISVNYGNSGFDSSASEESDFLLTAKSYSFYANVVLGIKSLKSFDVFLQVGRDDVANDKTNSSAQTLADRLGIIFGERRGTMKITTRHPQILTKLSNNIEVSRERMPGYDYDSETARTRDFAVTEVRKSLRTVEITLDDQKGIQDNSGDW